MEGTRHVSSGSNQISPEMDTSNKRKRSPEPKGFSKTGLNGAGQGHTFKDIRVDEVDVCAKRMKLMSLKKKKFSKKSSKKKEANPFDVDAGYEGDCEA